MSERHGHELDRHLHAHGVTPDDLDPLEAHLLAGLLDAETADASSDDGENSARTAAELSTLFECQMTSRLLDHTARWLRGRGHGYYTIGSAGHESNAAVGLATRITDPALLHYRSGGFYLGRAHQARGHNAVDDVLRGKLARTTEPISGGRHKVFGHDGLAVIPQTSTIASHLPRAVGLARSIALRDHDERIVICSFGDASLNHSTAQGALNWAAHHAHRGHEVPLLFVCEDNGLGISVPSPEGWVAAALGRSGLHTIHVDGAEPDDLLRQVASVVERVRSSRAPAVLHLRTVRFLAHAGSDAENAYRSPAEIRGDYARDPLLAAGCRLVQQSVCTGDELVEFYLTVRAEIRHRGLQLLHEPELISAPEVMAPITVHDAPAVERRAAEFAALHSGDDTPLTLAQTINATLRTIVHGNRRAFVFGEDVARKGGVYGVTRGLQREFGEDRVFDTLLDEQSILGLALGMGVDGGLPIPEIQYLAYLHNAIDQLRGEAATLPFFSQRRYANPMVVRVAGYAYQRGFGGHFHNDNSIAALRDIPGLVIASPGHPADAGPMLRSCAAAAEVDGTTSVFLEPIARYHTTDLFDRDGAWTAPPSSDHAPIGRARTHGSGADLTIVTFGNGLWLSLRAQRRLALEHGVHARVVDLRWIAPLPIEDVVREAAATGRVLMADETRRTGGVAEGVIASLVDRRVNARLARVTSHDSFIPLGDAANLVLLSEDDIVDGALRLVG